MKIGEYSIGSKNMEVSDDVSGIVNSFEYMFKRVEELVQIVIMEQKRESDMKYEALRAQINPHFLFNTLNTIKWSAIMSGSENVSKMISALGKLLEVSMNKGEDEITLKEEMELTESYVYIQNIKNNDKLKLVFDIDEELQELKILKLILQPIVENSINHGLKNKPGSGEIRISAIIKENKLVVTVRDDGVGISEEKVERILYADDENGRHKYNGIGLNNIHERLKIKYGSDYGLSIESEEGKGTKVDIILPVIKNAALGGGYRD
jgi:two-component system sensor histidine kinase YesM